MLKYEKCGNSKLKYNIFNHANNNNNNFNKTDLNKTFK